MSSIASIGALELLDSRGNPTLEAVVTLASGVTGRAMVPSGASVGSGEAIELRDGDARFHGKGVTAAVANITSRIAPLLQARRELDQFEVDTCMIEYDGTTNKSELGANSILAVSMAFARAQAVERELPLYKHIADLCECDEMRMPVPLMNVLNGGAHANNNLDIQEFMIVPVGASDIGSAIRCGSEVFHALRKALDEDGHSTAVGDEGGFAPNLQYTADALDYLCQAVALAGYTIGSEVVFALDCAATEFQQDGRYALKGEDSSCSGSEFCELLKNLVVHYPIVSIEDGLAEGDWENWKELTTLLGNSVQLVGDDIFVTNPTYLERGISNGVANSILVKVNQIGTLTETFKVMRIARAAGYSTVISHRSGETEDTFIADLAVGTGAGQIKTGSLSRSDRTAKYNQLLRIDAEASHAGYRGLREFPQHN